VRTDVSGPAVAEILAELARAHSSAISASEMTQGRGALMQSLPARFETNGAVAASFSDLFVYAFPLDYFQRLPAEYASVRAPAADKLAHRYLDPSTMVIIAVGDRKQVEPALAKLGIESIQVWPIAGTLF
jgi:zinc protease